MRPTRCLAVVLVLFAAGVRAEESPETDAPTYLGAELCVGCHEDAGTTFATSPHGAPLSDETRPEAGRGCEACHGPGSAHFEAGGDGHILAFAKADSAAARSKPCRSCHADAAGLHDVLGSEHARAGVACTDCHRLHQSQSEHLLTRPTPELCYGCHADIRARFALPEHHEVNEGVVACRDCHAVHGSKNGFELLAAHDRTCVRCHEDLSGPFVFEHGGLVTEGCVSCHEPHGSMNRHLLRRQQVAQLCYQCHTVTPSDHLQPNYRDCTRCHVAIHGPNTDPRFLER
jgi:DmsE family decaheme c-type cytochrome